MLNFFQLAVTGLIFSLVAVTIGAHAYAIATHTRWKIAGLPANPGHNNKPWGRWLATVFISIFSAFLSLVCVAIAWGTPESTAETTVLVEGYSLVANYVTIFAATYGIVKDLASFIIMRQN